MRSFVRCFAPILIATVVTTPAITGCAGHRRVYDPYDHQYHAWAPEHTYYNQWEQENHKGHKDYQKRSPDDQKQYWQWRQSHNQ